MGQIIIFTRILLGGVIRFFVNIFLKIKYSSKKIKFLKYSKIDSKCKFEGLNVIGEYTSLENCFVGLGSFTSRYNELSHVKIGRFCSLGSHIINTRGRHPASVFVSTHPCFYSINKVSGFTFSGNQYFKELKYSEDDYLVTIENDVWIGDNVTIMDGITIGNGAIIGANSLVVKDIEPYSINVGSPTKVIRYRFDENIISRLETFKWWANDIEWIENNSIYFKDITEFDHLLRDK